MGADGGFPGPNPTAKAVWLHAMPGSSGAPRLLYAYVILIIFGFVRKPQKRDERPDHGKFWPSLSQNLSDVTDVMPGFIRRKAARCRGDDGDAGDGPGCVIGPSNVERMVSCKGPQPVGYV
eukprot:Skav223782  [mRNA]  locus=scaffold575:85228:89861:+ [translate_table: standard]